MMNQFRVIIGIGFLAILGYSALWFTVAFDYEKQAASELSKLRDTGMKVSYNDISLAGFPYRIVIEIEDLALAGRAGGYAYASSKTELISHLWTPHHFIIQAEEVEASLLQNNIHIEDKYIRASLRRADDGKTIIAADSFTTDDLTIINAPKALETIGFNEWQVFLRLHEDPVAPASSLYEDRFIDFRIVLGGNKGDIEAIGGVSGKPILDWNRTELTDWRDSGGLLEFDVLSFALGGAKLEGNGSLTLDENLKLLGSVGFKTRRKLTDQHYARLNRYLVANDLTNYTLTPEALRTPLGFTLQNGQLAIENQTLRSIGSVVE
jgi:hypothetical protein